MLGQSCLAGTVLPDDREKLSRVDFEIDRIEHARPTRIAEAQVFDSDKCGTRISNLRRRRLLAHPGLCDALKSSTDDSWIRVRDVVVGLLDAFRLRLDSEQFECVTQSRWTHAACSEQFSSREHFGRRTVRCDFALAQNDYSIGGAQFLGLVLDYDQTQALRAQFFDQRRRLRPGPRDRDRWSARRARLPTDAARAPTRSRGAVSRRRTATSDRDARSRAGRRLPEPAGFGDPFRRGPCRLVPSRMRLRARRWSRTTATRSPGRPSRLSARRRRRGGCSIDSPAMRIAPWKSPSSNSGTMRLRHFASVDLPAPDAPITPIISPAFWVKLTARSAGRSAP